MSRVSYGSRAGDATDYGGGGHIQFVGPRHAARVGPYDSLEALIVALRQEFDAAAESVMPVCTTLEMSLGLTAVLPLVRPGIGPYSEGGEHDLPFEFKNGLYEMEHDPGQKHPRAPCSTIINVADARQKQVVQRAASRGIISAIEALDGFRYSFNNAWTAKDEEGGRFSFICQDSMQNKDRHANGYTRILKHLKDPGGAERGPRKPTYDCKGSVSIKFSSSRQSCDVFYRHNAIHETVAARKPAARAAAAAKRTSSSWIRLPSAATPMVPQGEEDTGGLSAMLQAETASSALALVKPLLAQSGPSTSNIGRPLKRKRDETAPPARPSDQPLSLADLLRQSETAKAPAPTNENGGKPTPVAAPVAYELPSWQTPPPALRQSADGLPYPLPYQPKGKTMVVTALTPSGTPAASKNPPHPQNFQQFRVSSSTPAPKQPPSQGLFTTMKMVPTNKPPLRWPQKSQQSSMNPPSATQYVAQFKHRSVLACTNCRLAKRRCDEGRPLCGACIKTGRSDCRYEPATGWKAIMSADSQQSPTRQNPSSAPAQSTPNSAQPTAQSAHSTGQQSAQTSHTGQTSQQTPQGTWENGNATQSSWPQSTSSTAQWQTPSAQQSTSSQQWPSQSSPPLQRWGNITIASPNIVRPSSPDPWYPKR